MNRTSTLLVFALLAAPQLALAQSSAKLLKDKDQLSFEEIERGFYFGVTAGPWFVLNPPASGTSKSPFSPGQTGQIEMGMDVGDRFSIAAFVMGTTNRAGSEYTGKSAG